MDRIFYSNEEFGKPSEMSLKRVDLNSQADYDALTSAQKNDGTKLYYIPTPNNNGVIYDTDQSIAYETYHGYEVPTFDPVNG